MFIAAIIIHIAVSIVIIVAVLFQVGKGATIGSTFGGSSSQAVFGASGGATFLSKVTTACAVVFMATSLFLTYTASRSGEKSIMGDLPEVATPAEAPAEPPLPEPVINVEVPETKEAAAPAAAAPKVEETAPDEGAGLSAPAAPAEKSPEEGGKK